jgi:hypothetical protein
MIENEIAKFREAAHLAIELLGTAEPREVADVLGDDLVPRAWRAHPTGILPCDAMR